MNALTDAWRIAGALQGVISLLTDGPERDLLQRIVDAISLGTSDAEQSAVPSEAPSDLVPRR